jgi:hypothetical protein
MNIKHLLIVVFFVFLIEINFRVVTVVGEKCFRFNVVKRDGYHGRFSFQDCRYQMIELAKLHG